MIITVVLLHQDFLYHSKIESGETVTFGSHKKDTVKVEGFAAEQITVKWKKNGISINAKKAYSYEEDMPKHDTIIVLDKATRTALFLSTLYSEETPSYSLPYNCSLKIGRDSSNDIEIGLPFMAAWEDDGIDPLFYNWLVEGSVERLAANLYGIAPETYISKVAYVDSLSFLCVLNGFAHDALPKATQQPELDVVFDMFGCQTDEEKMELLYMLYANEVIQQEPEEFMVAYSEKLGHEMTDDELIAMKIELKVSMLGTLNRYFYRYLAELTAEEKLTFEEICFLISGWEMDLNSHISYTDSSRMNTIMPLLEDYTTIQNAFFEDIAVAMEADCAELTELYNIFYSNLPVCQEFIVFEELSQEWEYFETAVFDAETNDFINRFFEGVSANKSTTIAEYYSSNS